MHKVGESLGWARIFQYWGYHNVLYTIRTGSMRRIQWYLERCDSTKTRGATPKDANGGGKGRLGAGFSILGLSQRALYHWNRLDEANPMVSGTLR
jgi:hypothetical protein